MLATGDLAGDAVMFDIDLHNRHVEIGLVLRPSCRGRHLGTDVVRVLCHYGCALRGLHRLQLTTLAGNQAMISAGVTAGFAGEPAARAICCLNGLQREIIIPAKPFR